MAVTYNGGATAPTEPDIYRVVATVNDPEYRGTALDFLVIVKASQTISFDPIPDQVATATVSLSATSSAGLPVCFILLPWGPAQLDGDQLTFTGPGPVTVCAVAEGNEHYYGALSFRSFMVSLASQTITFAPIPDQLATATLDLSASASSDLPVSFSVVSGPATLTGGNRLSFSGTGPVVINAEQAGNHLYAPAPAVARTIAVGYAPATVTLAGLDQEYTGAPRGVTATTSPAGLPVTILYNGGATVPIAPGVYAVAASIIDDYYRGSASATLSVAGMPEIVAQPSPVNVLVKGTAKFSVRVKGARPMSYQWRCNGHPITGATGDSLTLADLAEDQAGEYDVVVRNQFGDATSKTARLRVSRYALWGENVAGQSLPDDNPTPLAVALGWYHTLSLSSAGTVTAWGENARGQCDVPAGLSNVVAISGGAYHSLALKADGTVVTWGQELAGALPKPEDLTNVVAISAGGFHNLALRSDGTVAAWGYNWEHQCEAPTVLYGVVAVSAGAHHSLALGSDGRIFAWGDNTLGQCSVPPGVGTVKGIAAGSYHNMALRTDGTLYGWGDNRYLQLNVPSGLDRVVKAACGESHTLALRDDGTVVSWGHNQWLQSEAPPV